MLLTLKDGTQVRFNNPTIRNDSINGVAFFDVSTITTTVRRFSAGKTTLVFAGVAGVAGVVYATLAAVSEGIGDAVGEGLGELIRCSLSNNCELPR